MNGADWSRRHRFLQRMASCVRRFAAQRRICRVSPSIHLRPSSCAPNQRRTTLAPLAHFAKYDLSRFFPTRLRPQHARLTYLAYFAKYAFMLRSNSPAGQPTLWRTCRVLANRRRLQILIVLIRQPGQTVSSIARQIRLSLPAASQYLRALESRGLLTCRRVGRVVEYRPAATRTEAGGGSIATALRMFVGRTHPSPDVLFKLATAFTHPRRIEVYRAVKNGADSFVRVRARTHMSARALARHLAKLEARGFVRNEGDIYAVTNHAHPLGRVLAGLAAR
jgi:DNA-binding transcriptional ArsR family regulator